MTKKLKKPIAFVTVFAMLLSVLLFFPEGTFGGFGLGVRASAVEPEVPDGTGSSKDPYLIDSAGKLYWFASYVNEHYSHRGASARLTDDIVVNRNVLDGGGPGSHRAVPAWRAWLQRRHGWKSPYKSDDAVLLFVQNCCCLWRT